MDGLIRSLQEAGLIVDRPILDGKIHRVKIANKKSKDGWYIGHIINGKPVCVFGNWVTGEKLKYSGNGKDTYSEPDKIQWQKLVEVSKKEEEKRHKEAADKATKIMSTAAPAKGNHPYLKSKNILPSTALQVGQNLIIPLYTNTGNLTGYQTINPQGQKRYLPGTKKHGCCHPIPGNEDVLLICEGFSTGVTLNQATGFKVLCAMDCHNMYEVAKIAQKQYSFIIICADNDHQNPSNPGKAAAEKIFKDFKISFIFPQNIVGTDFNDMAREHNLFMVRDVINSKLQPEIYQKTQEIAYPDEIFSPPGLLKDVADYYNATAVKPQPLFAIASGLILGSIILGRRYVTNFNNYSSLYFLISAKSGTGKDHVKQVVREILLAANLKWMEGSGGFTAANTVINALESQPLYLAFFEEIGQKLGEAAKNPRSLSTGVFRQLLDIWSSCHSFVVGDRYADGTVPQAKSPALTMVGITTPRTFNETINETLIEGGFINRLIPFISYTTRQSTPLKSNQIEIPEKIIEFIKSIWLQGNLSEEGIPCMPGKRDEVLVKFTDAATKYLNEIEQEILDRSNHLEKMKLDDMPSRNREMAMRIALICAVMDGKPQIELSYIKWAYLLVKSLYQKYINEIKSQVGGSEFEKNKLLTLDFLRKCGQKGCSRSEMAKLAPMSRLKPKDRQEVLDDLQQSNLADILPNNGQKRGKSPEIWVALK